MEIGGVNKDQLRGKKHAFKIVTAHLGGQRFRQHVDLHVETRLEFRQAPQLGGESARCVVVGQVEAAR